MDDYDLAPQQGSDATNPRLKPMAPKPAAAPPASAASKPPAKSAAREHKCPYCGFSFAGAPKARCPDCAAAMDDSAADYLRFANPSWVRFTAVGLLLLIPGIAGHVLGCVFRMAYDVQNEPNPSKAFAHAGAALLLVLGVLIITRREASRPGIDAAPMQVQGRRGLAVRLLVLADLVLWLLMGAKAMQWLAVPWPLLKTFILLSLVVQGSVALLVGYCVRDLANRIPDDRLSAHAVYTGAGAAAVCAILFVLRVPDIITPAHLIIFTCSFPLIAAIVVLLAWGMMTLLLTAVNMRASAHAGDDITARRLQRMSGRKV